MATKKTSKKSAKGKLLGGSGESPAGSDLGGGGGPKGGGKSSKGKKKK